MRRRPQWLAFLVNPSELCHLSADRQRCWDAVHSIIHSRLTIVLVVWMRRQASPHLVSPPNEQMKGKLSPRPSGRPEPTSVTCSYSMRAPSVVHITLTNVRLHLSNNCDSTPPTAYLSVSDKSCKKIVRKISIRSSGSTIPVLGSSFPTPTPYLAAI